MTQDVKRLAIFSIKAILIVLLTDFVVGQSLASLYDKMAVGEKARANYFLKKDTSSVIVFGSSRALYHYHSGIMADSLNMTVYNAGRSNQGILYDLAALKYIVKRHKPKLVVLDVSEDEFVKSQKKYEMLSALLPYYRCDKDIAGIYDVVKPGYKFWSWSRTLPYNSSFFAIIYRGLKPGKEKDKDIRGFLGREGVYRNKLAVVNNCDSDPVTDTLLEKSFQEFVGICQYNKIKLFVAISPRYSRYKCERTELTAMRRLAAPYGVQIHNYAELELPGDHFSDVAHLNSKGAIEFTRIVAKDLKAFYNEQR